MKKLFTLYFIGSSILLGSNSAKADWDKVFIYNPESGGTEAPYQIYKVNNETGTYNLQTTSSLGNQDYDSTYFDNDTGKLYFQINNQDDYVYDFNNDAWSTTTSWQNEFDGPGTLIDRFPPIRRSGDTISIGDNSLKLKETSTEQQLWGTNADGEIVPLNIVNGSKLLINGRDVEQSINNVGALSAALTGLPTVPTDTTLACGFGTGTHGGDFAFSGGCASKVNEKLSINYAASMTMPGQDYAGDFEDQFSARAGFVWQLGKSVKPSLISMKDKQKLTNEINDLKSKNKNLNEKIATFETEKLNLLARLERLEKIALGESKS